MTVKPEGVSNKMNAIQSSNGFHLLMTILIFLIFIVKENNNFRMLHCGTRNLVQAIRLNSLFLSLLDSLLPQQSPETNLCPALDQAAAMILWVKGAVNIK